MDPDPAKPSPASSGLSDHLAESIDALSEFHLAHYRGASALQRALDRLTGLLSAPAALVAITLLIAGWAESILVFSPRGGHQAGFVWLGLAASCAALWVAILILVTQRREEALAERRDRLILEFVILSDKKAAKIIALLEEMRRDAPNLHDRVDTQSDDMAVPTDVQEVVAAIDQFTPDT